MKKIVSLMLASTLFISAGTSVAFAGSWKNGIPPGLAKKGKLPPGIAKKVVRQFDDIDEFNWAEKSIEKMAIKGVVKGIDQGKFAPQRAVTKLEAIIMALRVMGYEEDAKSYLEKIIEGEKEFELKDNIAQWAYGYISLAEEKGILDKVDMLDFKLNEPAKRYEVAKYLIRALGYEEEAKDHMDEELDFIDEANIPLGAVGYVYLANEKDIITGYPDGTFKPNKPVTRAEIAVMVNRLDEKVDSEIDQNEKYAEVVGVDDDEVTVKVGNQLKEFDVIDNVPVYNEEGKYVSMDEVEIGMKIKLQFNEKDTVIFIEIKESEDKKIVREYEGKVDHIDDDEITVKADNIRITFEIEDDVEILFDDEVEGKLEDILEGDEVELRVNEDDEVVYIEVDRELEEKEYEGEVVDVDDEDITIKVDSLRMTFDVEDDVEILFDDEVEGKLEDILEGDEVELRVNEDDEVVYIEVDRELEYEKYNGYVIDVDDDSLSINISRRIITFDIDSDFEVDFQDEDGEISDLEVGDEITVVLDEDNDVYEIIAKRDLDADMIIGELVNVYDDNNQIVLKDDSEYKIYNLSSDVEIYLNDDEIDLSDLEDNDNLRLKLNSYDKVVEIRAYRLILE